MTLGIVGISEMQKCGVCNPHYQSLNRAQKSGAEAPQFSFGK